MVNIKNSKIYDSIEPGYYHKKFLSGNRIQRFWHKHKFETIFSKIKLDKSKSILDIGCGPGTFLSMMDGKYKLAYGIDIAKKQVGFAKKNFRGKNLFWKAAELKDMGFKKRTFDYVFMIELIEHLEHDEMKKLIKRIKPLLKKSGYLIITTPNYVSPWPIIEMVLNRVSKVSYEEQHITKFTKKRLKNLLNDSGFNIKSVETFYLISPFLALISQKLSENTLKLERKLFKNYFGCLFFIELIPK